MEIGSICMWARSEFLPCPASRESFEARSGEGGGLTTTKKILF